jgi:hypothetical protein
VTRPRAAGRAGGPGERPADRPADRPTAQDWAGVVLVVLGAALSALVEAFLVPLYAGTVLVPVAVVLALAGNLAFPRLARALVPRTIAAVAPVLAWLAVMFVFLAGRPEGDVAFPGSPTGAVWVFYGTLFGGVLAGIAAVVTAGPPPGGPQRPDR